MENERVLFVEEEGEPPHRPEPIVLDRATTRPANFRPVAPILALLALAALLTGCIYHDGRPVVYGYGYYGGYYGGHGDGHHGYGWRNRWHRGDGYYGHHHHHGYGYGHGRWH